MKKASVMREKCCSMVLHGGRPCPIEVVDALTEVEAERDALQAKVDELSVAVAGASSSAFAAGFEACREMAAGSIEANHGSRNTVYDKSRRDAAKIIRALQPEKQGDDT